MLPQPPIYAAPPARTMAECDAALRHPPIDAIQSRRIGAVLRYTGLRISQVVSVRRRDLGLAHGLLTVTTGKSRAEKAEMRTIPVWRSFVAEVGGWVEATPEDALLVPA